MFKKTRKKIAMNKISGVWFCFVFDVCFLFVFVCYFLLGDVAVVVLLGVVVVVFCCYCCGVVVVVFFSSRIDQFVTTCTPI